MKRRWIVVLALVFIVGVGSSSFAADIKDVDPSHWAYQNVKMLIDKGYISLYEDSTFRGDRNVTRYQLAEIVAKILTNMNSGTVTASEGDIKTIRELAVELRKELVDVVQKQGLFSEEIDQLKKNQIVVKEDIARSQQQVLEIIDQLIRLKELEQKYDAVTQEQDVIKEQIIALEQKMDEGVASGIGQLRPQITEIDQVSRTNAQTIALLQEENNQLRNDIANLQEKNSRMLYYIIGGVLIAILIR